MMIIFFAYNVPILRKLQHVWMKAINKKYCVVNKQRNSVVDFSGVKKFRKSPSGFVRSG